MTEPTVGPGVLTLRPRGFKVGRVRLAGSPDAFTQAALAKRHEVFAQGRRR